MTEIKTKDQAKNQKDKETDFEAMLQESFQKMTAPAEIGDKIEAEVVAVQGENIFLDIGARIEGIVPKSEFSGEGEPDISVGEKVEVFVIGEGNGVIRCAREMRIAGTGGNGSDGSPIPPALKEACDQNIPVEGLVTAVTKGGFDVTVMGRKTFCPISQIGKKYCEIPDQHLNKSYTFVIQRIDEERSDIVVSRKEYLAKEDEERARKLWEKITIDDVYEGTVAAVRDFGAFVDIGGIEGLLHVSEISNRRISDARDVLKVGQTVKVAVKNIDAARRKVGLSIKPLLEDPWTEALKNLSRGREVEGKVVRIKPYGAFIELFPGIDGLVHISKLGAERRVGHPKEVLRIGETVKVRVLDINETERRISLTMEEQEIDYHNDLDRLKLQQEKDRQKGSGSMADLLDSALQKKP